MSFRIYLSPPDVGANERNLLLEAFDSNWIAPFGPALNEFEALLSETIGTNVSAVSSGTAALHLLLKAHHIGAGDYVLCSNITFAATVFAVDYVGAKAILVGSDSQTWNMCPDALSETLAWCKKEGIIPKALLVTHLYGMPADVFSILEICKEHDIVVIEDAAEALGSSYFGGMCGNLADGASLSFNGNKIITTSSGGAVCTNNEDHLERVKFWANQAKDNTPFYMHHETGYNYRLSNLSAAVGLGQLQCLEEKVAKKRAIFERYQDALEPLGFQFQEEPALCESNRWLTVALIPENEKASVSDLIEYLKALGIEARHMWTPMHMMPLPYLVKTDIDLNGDLDIFTRGICLPSGTGLTEDQQTEVIEAIKAYYQSL